MYLKSLTAKGFKSFASATTLNFEPGITCVVGPNGSGKSNVVDALAWVMGEQGPKTLRGGKMDDVIFAGTATRPPLGRAEVSLTIDNTDGALPIEYTEVTISRTLFRGGGSEYSINGAPCRLLDIQELLSDSGIGREMHVIVGQGQLDQILVATPEERRGFIEEAAGVLKHRRRKEKALRKLEAAQGNLVRLQDLTNELRRQLKPLGRQAELARKAAVFQADARDARLRLLADDLLQLSSALEKEIADENILRAKQSAVESQLAAENNEIAELEQLTIDSAPRLSKAQDAWFTLSALRERYIGLRQVVGERIRLTAVAPDEKPRGLDPEVLDQQAMIARDEAAALNSQMQAHQLKLDQLVATRVDLEQQLSEIESLLASAAQSTADRREQLAKLAGDVAAVESRRAARSAEVARLAGQVSDAKKRAAEAETAYRKEEAEIAGLDAGELKLDSEHEQAGKVLAAAESNLIAAREELNALEREYAGAVATVLAIETSIARQLDGGSELVAKAGSGFSTRLIDEIKITPSYELAVSIALNQISAAVLAPNLSAAKQGIDYLVSNQKGRAVFAISVHPANPVKAIGDVRPLLDFITADGDAAIALNTLLADCLVVSDLDSAIEIYSAHPHLRVATKNGELVGPGFLIGGSTVAETAIQNQTDLAKAIELRNQLSTKLSDAKNRFSSAKADLESAQTTLASSLTKVKEAEAAQVKVALKLAELSEQSRAAAAEAERLELLLSEADRALKQDLEELSGLQRNLDLAQSTPSASVSVTPEQRNQLMGAVADARSVEIEHRLVLRTAEERHQVALEKVAELENLATTERDARTQEVERRVRLQREAAIASAVSIAINQVLERLEISLSTASATKAEFEQQRATRDTRLQSLRQSARALEAERSALVDSVHRDELARTEQRARIAAIEDKALSDFGVSPDVLIAEYGPDQLVPPSMKAPGDEESSTGEVESAKPYQRAEQEKRAKEAERQLALLGRVNPLALEEFQAMEERHKFLGEQLEDVKQTKADLEQIIKEVDDRVQQVFAEAFADTAREFQGVFARLFPGGEGKLVLVDPDNLLLSGVDVEARPAGKKVKRLSLLSGGERSLVAVAFLVSLFKARPSPFYVLDEVEAALDDVNLGRLLQIYEELREDSQLIVITHQKRTMEIADALYGVSMRNDGVSAVISQRIRDIRDQLVESQ